MIAVIDYKELAKAVAEIRRHIKKSEHGVLFKSCTHTNRFAMTGVESTSKLSTAVGRGTGLSIRSDFEFVTTELEKIHRFLRAAKDTFVNIKRNDNGNEVYFEIANHRLKVDTLLDEHRESLYSHAVEGAKKLAVANISKEDAEKIVPELKRVAIATSKNWDDSSNYMGRVLLMFNEGRVLALATDNKRMARKSIEGLSEELYNLGMTLVYHIDNQKLIHEILEGNNASVTWEQVDDTTANILVSSDTKTLSYTKANIQKATNFSTYSDRIVARRGDYADLTIDKKALAEALDVVSLKTRNVAVELVYDIDKDMAILSDKKGVTTRLICHCNRQETVKASFNNTFVLDVLKLVDSDDVTLTVPTEVKGMPYRIELDDGFEYILMPMTFYHD